MQNKTKIQDKSVGRTIFRIGKWLIPLVLCWLFYKKFFSNHTFSLLHFWEQLKMLPLSYYFLLFVFACCNWSLETIKWRILLKPFNPLPFGKAFRSVLSGVTVSQLLPYKTGEYLGRMLMVKDENKLNAVVLSIVGSFSQLLVTLLFGIIGFLIVKPIPYASAFVLSLSVLLLVAFLTYYFLPGMRFSSKLPYGKKLQTAMTLITGKELFKIMSLSVLRYFSFLLPYALLAWHFGLSNDASLSYQMFAVSTIFFIQTISPNFIITDIALRLTIPVIVFSKGNISIAEMDYVPGMVIYIFNVAIPMVIGAIFIMFARVRQ